MSWDLSKKTGRFKAWLDMHVVDHGAIRAIYNNFHDLGGGMYRSSQPSPAQIRRYHRKLGIKTILNLRGPSEYGSYALEQDICDKLGIRLIDAKLFSRGAPSHARIHMLRDLFDSIEYPALMHCKSGADRAGIAAALYRMLHLGQPVEAAMSELHWRYGHSRKAKTGVLDFFLASYAAHNARTPTDFMTWVDTVYDDEAVKKQFRADGWSSLIVDKVLHRE